MKPAEIAKLIEDALRPHAARRVVTRDFQSIPVVLIEDRDGVRHHIRVIDVRGREHDSLDATNPSRKTSNQR